MVHLIAECDQRNTNPYMHKKVRAKRAALAVHLQSGLFWVSEKAPKKVTGQNEKHNPTNLPLSLRGAFWSVCRIGLQVYKA